VRRPGDPVGRERIERQAAAVRTLHRVRPQGRDHSASGLGGEHIGFMPFPTLREQRIASVWLGRLANGSLVS